jgi:hypothetical protein
LLISFGGSSPQERAGKVPTGVLYPSGWLARHQFAHCALNGSPEGQRLALPLTAPNIPAEFVPQPLVYAHRLDPTFSI